MLDDFPGWIFKGRTYKTVAGLSKAIFKDSGCDSHSMVVNHMIIATTGRRPAQGIVAVYDVERPRSGIPVRVTRREGTPDPIAIPETRA